MGRKDIWHADELIGIIGEAPLPPPVGCDENLIVSCIDGKYELVIAIGGIHRIPCILSNIPYYLELPIIVWKFPVDGDIVKSTNLKYILTPRFVYVDYFSVVSYLITSIYVFHHELYFIIQEIDLLRMFMVVSMILQKSVI